MSSSIVLHALLVWAVSARLAGAEAYAIPRVAFFKEYDLINTSLEPANPLEDRRRQMLDDLLREKLNASGRFKIVSIPPDMQREIADGPAIRNCNGCQRDFAKRVGADLAAWGTVQKVSNLILNINVYMEDAQTGKMNFMKSVDIRGNTDRVLAARSRLYAAQLHSRDAAMKIPGLAPYPYAGAATAPVRACQAASPTR